MAVTIARGTTDQVVDQIVPALESYSADHPAARIDLYRQNSASVRVRIIDSAFAGQGLSERNRLVWTYLHKLGGDAAGDVSMLLLLTPEETAKSLGNLEFEDPVPSVL